MANSLLTSDIITRECLRVLQNKLVLTRNVNRQYDKSFAQEGAKIGATLRIRKPDRVLVTNGPSLVVQDENQEFTTLTASTQKHIGLAFTSAELTMSLDDFSQNIIVPRVSQLASTIDADVANCYRYIGQSVGTPGTTPSTTQVLLAGQQKLNESAATDSPRYATVNPAANAGLVEGMKGFFNPTGTIASQFKSGMMGQGVLGFDEVTMSQSIQQFTTGTRTGTCTVNGTISTQGVTTLALTINSGGTVKLGDVFTIAACNAVNPQTRQSTGSLYQFVALADATATSTSINVTVAPIYDQNYARATLDVLPQTGAAVTWLGAASTIYPQNLIYHPDAITFATADLVMPKGMDMSSRVNDSGISMRFVRGYDIQNDRMISRLDVLYGYAVIRPEMAARLWG